MRLLEKFNQQSIALNFLLVVTIGLFFGQLVFGLINISRNYQRQQFGLQKKASDQAYVLSTISGEYILTYNFLSLETLIQSITNDAEYVYIVITSKDGTPLTSSIDLENEFIKAAASHSEKISRVEIMQALATNPDILEIIKPVMANGSEIGYVHLYLTTKPLVARLQGSILETFVSFLALLLALIFLIKRQFTRRVQAPLIGLGTVASQFASGNFEVRAETNAGKEIREIQLTFNRMAEQIQVNVQELEKLSYVVNQTDNLVVICNPQGQIEWVNEAFVTKTGFSLYESIGHKPGSFLQGPETDLKTVAYIRGQIAEQKPFNCTILNYSKSGERYWLAIEAQPVFNVDGDLINFVAIETDITKKREADIALIKAKNTAEAVAQAKSDFLTNLSHEIRTPMNGIMGVTELLNDTGLDEEQASYIEIIEESSDRLMNIIEKILDLSDVEKGTIQPDILALDLVELIDGVVNSFEEEAAEKQIAISFLPSDMALAAKHIQSDATLIEKAISNLIDNAIRFTPKGAVAVTLSAEKRPHEHYEFRVDVIDTGIGIHADQLKTIFKSFTQVDSSLTRAHQGNGLGLSISQGMAEALGGQIKVQSQEGEGSTFSLIFNAPLAENPATKKSDPEVA